MKKLEKLLNIIHLMIDFQEEFEEECSPVENYIIERIIYDLIDLKLIFQKRK